MSMSRRDAIRSWRRSARRARTAFAHWYTELTASAGAACEQTSDVERARYGRMLEVTKTPHMVITKIDRERGEVTYEHRGYESVHAKLGDSPWGQG